MDEKKKLVAVAGLRTADPTTLAVLTQDVLRTPLVRIEPGTLADLLALSELGTAQLPSTMAKELERFQRQMFRELADLPDGPSLTAYIEELHQLAADQVPTCLRTAVTELVPERRDEESLAAMQAFLSGVEGTEPATVSLPTAPQEDNVGSAPVEKVKTKPKKASTRKRTVVTQVDERRGLWIEADVLERVSNYHNGLKESILVAGARHRAPWDDVTEKEVMAVLRRLKREGRIRFSAGRWLSPN